MNTGIVSKQDGMAAEVIIASPPAAAFLAHVIADLLAMSPHRAPHTSAHDKKGTAPGGTLHLDIRC